MGEVVNGLFVGVKLVKNLEKWDSKAAGRCYFIEKRASQEYEPLSSPFEPKAGLELGALARPERGYIYNPPKPSFEKEGFKGPRVLVSV